MLILARPTNVVVVKVAFVLAVFNKNVEADTTSDIEMEGPAVALRCLAFIF